MALLEEMVIGCTLFPLVRLLYMCAICKWVKSKSGVSLSADSVSMHIRISFLVMNDRGLFSVSVGFSGLGGRTLHNISLVADRFVVPFASLHI